MTTAVLISLEEEKLKKDWEGAASVWMNCMLCMSLLTCVAAAIFRSSLLKGGSNEGKRRGRKEEDWLK